MLQSKYLTENELSDFGFKHLGKNVQISSDARVYGAKNISIGNNVRIDDFAILVATSGYISIGHYASVMRGCHLSGAFGISLLPFSHLAANCILYSASDDYSGNCMTTISVPSKYLSYRGGPIVIGRHVILGASCVILGECGIGDGCAVGCMSMVNKDLQPWGIYAGVPAKRIKERSKHLLDLEREFLGLESMPS